MAGPISVAALAASPVTPAGCRWRRHCPESEYLDYVRDQDIHPGYRNQKIRYFRVFKAAWPKMAGWFGAPLVERVGRLPDETQKTASYPISFNARPYLLFLGLRGYVTYDYAWMFGAEQIRVDDAATALGIDLGAGELIAEAVPLGYNPGSARQAMRWTVGRIALHTGVEHASEIADDHIIEALEAIRQRSPPVSGCSGQESDHDIAADVASRRDGLSLYRCGTALIAALPDVATRRGTVWLCTLARA